MPSMLRNLVTKAKDPEATGAGAAGRRAVLTLFDQGVSSISNFAVTVVVARLAGAAGLGYFSFAYAAWQLLSAFHRAVVTDPMTMTGDVRVSTERGRIRQGLAAELLLGASGALVAAIVGASLEAAGQRGYGTAMMSLAPWIPVLLLQDYWRWIGFMIRRPGQSLLNDTVFNCVQGAAFAAVFIFHVHSLPVIVAAWGLGGLAGAAWGAVQYRVTPALGGGWSLLTARWGVSKWLAGDTLLNSAANQSSIFIAGAILGPVGLGGLRAARTLVTGPSMVLVQAGGSIGLPEATNAYARKGWRGLSAVSRIITALGLVSTGACVAAVVVWGPTLLRVVYGASFARYQTAAVLYGVALMLVSLELGPLLVLKATRNTHWTFAIQIINVVTSVGSALGLALAYGVDGAAAASTIRCGASAAGCAWFKRKCRLAEGSSRPRHAAPSKKEVPAAAGYPRPLAGRTR